jgi:RNA-binding protein
MTLPILTTRERQALKARAHDLDPIVMIGDAGLTAGVMREIERALAAHELIKIRIAGDDRDLRVELFAQIALAASAHPVQRIGKLLVLYRPKPATPESSVPAGRASRASPAVGKSRARDAAPPKRVRGMPAPRPTRRTAGKGVAHPPRTARVRKSGQRSTKKPFQSE